MKEAVRVDKSSRSLVLWRRFILGTLEGTLIVSG